MPPLGVLFCASLMLSNPPALPDPARPAVVPAEGPAALRRAASAVLRTADGPADDEAVARLLRYLTDHDSDARRGRLVVAPPDSRVTFAAVPVPLGGGVSLLLCPDVLGEAAADDALAAVSAALLAAADADPDLRLVQALRPADHDPLAPALLHLGFEPAADLQYMARRVHRPPRDSELLLPDGLAALAYSAATRGRFGRALELSYAGSLDCPRMQGLRTTDEILDGHRAAGEFRPDWWSVIVPADDSGEADPLAVLILAALPDGGGTELVYVGVSPAARGRGLGATLVRRALAVAAGADGRTITLAADAANWPALRLYERNNFRRLQTRRVMLRTAASVL